MQPVATTNYIPEVSPEKCIGCGKCAKVCPILAISMEEAGEDTGSSAKSTETQDTGYSAKNTETQDAGSGAEKKEKTRKKHAKIDTEICLGCGVCARNCPTKAIELNHRPIQVITPVNSTHRFVLQAIEKGTLQNLIFDNQAFANHRAMAAVFGTILQLPPLKQALASKQFKSVYLDKLLSMQRKKKEKEN